MRILLVEDEVELARWVTRALEQGGFVIEHVTDGLKAEARLMAEEYDAVVLDLRLPGKDGLAVLKAMRGRDDRTPVLILTAQDTLDERVRGLNGADDYLPKPFAIAELEARILALIRRSRGRRIRACNAARWCSTASAQLHTGGAPLSLTPRESTLLGALLARSGQPLTKAQLLDKVFSLDADVSPDAIEVLVYRLRKKLSGHGVTIVTLRGFGYLLEPEAAT
jgi:two-component system response regulator TctD